MKYLVFFLFSFSVMWAQVDINHANKGELMSLKGIGESKAEAIIAYRTKQCFASMDDLMNVKGIGVSTVEKNRNDILIRKCEK